MAALEWKIKLCIVAFDSLLDAHKHNVKELLAKRMLGNRTDL